MPYEFWKGHAMFTDAWMESYTGWAPRMIRKRHQGLDELIKLLAHGIFVSRDTVGDLVVAATFGTRSERVSAFFEAQCPRQ